ncbi:fimbrial protein, partial [Serratia marcescens]|nr:fimbrial protein [Serratia marcescens]
ELTVDANDPSKNNNKVSLTFSGSASDADSALLGITGTAKGAGIALTDGSGKKIKLGTASDARLLQNGSNTLSFSAYLQGSSASGAVIVPGEFQSVADFTLAYQ